MQTASQSLPGVTTGNIRPSNLVPDFNRPDSPSSTSNSQLLPLQKYRIPKKTDGNSDHATGLNCLLQRNGYSIHLVNSLKQRIKASTLIKRMYAARGYNTGGASVFSAPPSQYTFEARQSEQLIGTLTLTIDADNGLLADTLYRTELDQFRQQGHKLCEVSKLAFNLETSSKEIFASIFHMAYIFSHHIHSADDAFIEINPRHATFYKRMLGFRQIGELRTCPRVNAPAILLHLDVECMKRKILALAGQFAHKGRSIYPHFLTRNRERRIIQLIQAKQTDHTHTPSTIHKTGLNYYPQYFQPT